jgi:hypothetical protein
MTRARERESYSMKASRSLSGETRRLPMVSFVS